MKRQFIGLGLLSFLALSACTVAPPSGPSVVAMPGPGKDWNQFQQDDAFCRSYAQRQMPNPQAVAQATQQNGAGTAVVGTLIGAAAGAALGAIGGNAGLGAAAGAGAGFLGGSLAAGNQSQATANSLQARYDVAYAQCMVGHGESIQQPSGPYYGPPPAYDTAPPPPPGYYNQPY
jgi:Glycine-zipper domain